MKTLDIEIAVMEWYGVQQNLIVPNVGLGFHHNYADLHECDLIVLTRSGYATEVEIKVSKHDLLKDKEKRHNHIHKLITNLYFAVPEKLKDLALQEIPKRAGLFVVIEGKDEDGQPFCDASVIRRAERSKKSVKWTPEQRLHLAKGGAIRILGLKQKLRRSTGISHG